MDKEKLAYEFLLRSITSLSEQVLFDFKNDPTNSGMSNELAEHPAKFIHAANQVAASAIYLSKTNKFKRLNEIETPKSDTVFDQLKVLKELNQTQSWILYELLPTLGTTLNRSKPASIEGLVNLLKILSDLDLEFERRGYLGYCDELKLKEFENTIIKSLENLNSLEGKLRELVSRSDDEQLSLEKMPIIA